MGTVGDHYLQEEESKEVHMKFKKRMKIISVYKKKVTFIAQHYKLLIPKWLHSTRE